MFPIMHLCRHCVAHLTGRPFLWALLYHDVPGRAWRHKLQEGHLGSPSVLGLLPRLDSAAVFRLESLRTRGTRNHLLGWLDNQDDQQHLVHHLPLHLLPHPPIPHHCLLLWEAATRSKTGEAPCLVQEAWRLCFLMMCEFWSEFNNSKGLDEMVISLEACWLLFTFSIEISDENQHVILNPNMQPFIS